MVSIIEEKGDALGTDVITTYLNGTKLYSENIKSDIDWKGVLHDVNLYNWKSGSFAAQNWDVDYLKVGKYEKATATVASTATVKSGMSLELAPQISSGALFADYNVKIADESKLTYVNGKFWGGETLGETTVTFDFVDDNMTDLTTTVTVEEAPAEIPVSEVVQSDMFGEKVTLVVGQEFELNDIYSALPEQATNRTLSYTIEEGSDLISVDGGLLKGLKAGTAKLKVAATDTNAHSQTFDIVVKPGYHVDFSSIESTKTWTEPQSEIDMNGWTGLGYNNKSFAPISVVEDNMFGKTVKFTGVANGASHVDRYVKVDELSANKDYIISGWAKVEADSGVNAANVRLDAKLMTYYVDEKGIGYGSTEPYKVQMTSLRPVGQGWVYFEIATRVNLDTAKYQGFKVELGCYNTVANSSVYVTNVTLTEMENVNLKSWALEQSEASYELSNGGTLQITAKPTPSAANLPVFAYVSSDEEVATVDANGLITAGTKNGTAEITVTAGTTTKKVVVVVKNFAEKVELSEETVELNPEGTASFDLIVTPSYAPSVFTATSANPEIATATIVEGKLVVTGVAVGSTTITLTTGDSEATYVLNVTVSHAPTLNLSSASASIMVTQTVQIEATANYVEGTISYVSSDETVATVNESGLVTAVKVGQATITVSVDGLTKEFVVTVTELVAQSLTLAENAAQIKEGITVQINATVSPAGRTITYTSSDATVATVNASGLVTAVKAGTATITVTSDSLNKTFTVTVIEQTKITLSTETVTIKENKTHTIDVTVTPAGHTPTFVSSNPQVATVSATGVVKGVKAGTATITITADDKTATFTVVVEEQTAQAISVNKDKATLEIGKTLQLEATVVPANRTITFETSDATIATVSESGLITAVKAGKAIIKVKSDDKVVEVEITVVEPVVEEPTPTPTPEPTPTPTPTPEPSKKGCKGSVIGSIIAATTLAGAALILKKKKDEE